MHKLPSGMQFLPVLLGVLYSDRFLPDKAIDLIDEAGSRVRLRHAQVCAPLDFFLSLTLIVPRLTGSNLFSAAAGGSKRA